jgi:hypothetical protein
MLQITKYQYNNLCDTYGCNNRAKHSLGREGYPKRAAHNLCDACLKDIAMQVPIGMILKREDLQSYIQAQILEGTEAARELMGIDAAIETEPVEKMTTVNPSTLAPEEISVDDLPFSDDLEAELVGSYTYKELQGMAKELGIPSFGVKKDELQESVLKALKER